ncbi:MAG: hypothetical protein Fur0022_24030 [Anaerolineales bacterium]
MDADYYLLGGIQLSEGKGFTEPILWNYLDDPAGLPHPSHGYWMPLTSILAAISLYTPFEGFTGGRIIFILLTGLIPPMTAHLAWNLLPDRGARPRQHTATLAGLLAVFPGFYLSFLTVPDAFGVYMLLGAGFLILVHSEVRWRWFGLGILAGWMHLARADGFLWLGMALIAIVWEFGVRNRAWVWGIGHVLAGYLLVMGPWMVRNWFAFGTLLAPGGARALWVLTYDELFSFPAEKLTFARWWASGLGAILQARGEAFGQNMQTLLGVQGAVFLLPLIGLGLWKLRGQRTVQIGVLAWGLTLAVMTLAFPFSGARGGFFHSGAAVQSLFWAVVPVGLEVFVEWGRRVRGWRVAQAQRVFGAGLVGLAFLFTVFIFVTRVLPKGESVGYADVEAKLVELGAKPDEIVMVNNPPGYFLASGRPAVVIPHGDLSVWEVVARRYEVVYLVVDENVPVEVRQLLENQAQMRSARFLFLGGVGNFQIYRVLMEGR